MDITYCFPLVPHLTGILGSVCGVQKSRGRVEKIKGPDETEADY